MNLTIHDATIHGGVTIFDRISDLSAQAAGGLLEL
jgi:hypothetical protein